MAGRKDLIEINEQVFDGEAAEAILAGLEAIARASANHGNQACEATRAVDFDARYLYVLPMLMADLRNKIALLDRTKATRYGDDKTYTFHRVHGELGEALQLPDSLDAFFRWNDHDPSQVHDVLDDYFQYNGRRATFESGRALPASSSEASRRKGPLGELLTGVSGLFAVSSSKPTTVHSKTMKSKARLQTKAA